MEEPKVVRKLFVDFDKSRLNNSIMLQMRRLRIPFNMRGADLLKGVVYGKIRHPEISIEKAVEQAVEASKLPGATMTLDDGFYYLMEVIEIASEKDLFQTDYELETVKSLVTKLVDNVIIELDKQFCYGVVCECLKDQLPGYGHYTLSVDIIRCMLFKKIFAPESTFKCMVDYACRKVGQEIEGRPLDFDELLKYVSQNPIVGGDTNADRQLELQNTLDALETWIYDNYPSYEVEATPSDE